MAFGGSIVGRDNCCCRRGQCCRTTGFCLLFFAAPRAVGAFTVGRDSAAARGLCCRTSPTNRPAHPLSHCRNMSVGAECAATAADRRRAYGDRWMRSAIDRHPLQVLVVLTRGKRKKEAGVAQVRRMHIPDPREPNPRGVPGTCAARAGGDGGRLPTPDTFFFRSAVLCGAGPWASSCSRSRSPAHPLRGQEGRGPPCPLRGQEGRGPPCPWGAFPGKIREKSGSMGRAARPVWAGVSLGPCPRATGGAEEEGRERAHLWGDTYHSRPLQGGQGAGKVHLRKECPVTHIPVLSHKGRCHSRWVWQPLLCARVWVAAQWVFLFFCCRTKVVGTAIVGAIVCWHNCCWRDCCWHNCCWRDCCWHNCCWRDCCWHNCCWHNCCCRNGCRHNCVGAIAVGTVVVSLHKTDRPPDILFTRTKKKSEVVQVQLMHIRPTRSYPPDSPEPTPPDSPNPLDLPIDPTHPIHSTHSIYPNRSNSAHPTLVRTRRRQ